MIARLVMIGLLCALPMAAQAQVVASIKPVHSLAARLLAGTGIEAVLLVEGRASMHSFTLRPSQAKALAGADLVFYTGDALETFLAPLVPSLGARAVALAGSPGVTLHPLRPGHEDHNHDEHDHAGPHDLHVWLSVANARAMSARMVQALSARYPGHRARIAANAAALDASLKALDTLMRQRMQPLAGRPFASFHDATQYFDRDYGLAYGGSLTLHPEHGISAKRAAALRGKIIGTHIRCVFREPQFDPKAIDALIAGTGAKSESLDAEGAAIDPGPEFYPALMRGVAGSFEKCLN